jgi:proteasome component ECM29
MQVEKEEKKTTLEDKRKNAENDLTSLSRVSHRLAMVDTTEKLSQVLDKLLPRLLVRIGENHQSQQSLSGQGDGARLHAVLTKIHAKLVEMLSHTMKRVREDKQCRIPCRGILQLLVVETAATATTTTTEGKKETSNTAFVAKESIDPFTLNLSLTFLTLGLSRCSSSEQWEGLLPGLLVLHGTFSALAPEKLLQSPSTKSQWHQVTHLLVRTMDYILQDEEKGLQASSSSSSFVPNSSKRLKPSETTTTTTTTTDATTSIVVDEPLLVARNLLAHDERTAGACYELLLDLLLYQTTPSNSSVPPPGMSQAGHVRLKSGTSETARDWAAEMAPRSRLVQLKSRCLDWIAPSRRWGLFQGDTAGRTRTLTLLIAAAGDPTPEVSQRAMTYLKQHLDAERDTDTTYGDPGRLVQELLIMCVGASNAQIVLAKQQQSGADTTKTLTLGIYHELVDGDTTTNQQSILSFRRRMVSETTFATMVDYVAKILEEVPQLFAQEDAVLQQQRVGSVGSLAVLACTKMLSQLRTSSGLTMLRGKQYVSAAQLLNALVVRLSTIKSSAPTSTDDDLMVVVDDVVPALLAKSMAIACSCLSTVVSSKGNTSSGASTSSNNRSSGSEGNTSVRDALYGVVCVLSRSNLTLDKMSWIFALGDTTTSSSTVGISIETAILLFGCIAGEEEALRPRSVAALDALLASYCRLVSKDGNAVQTKEDTTKPAVVDNPWGQMASDPTPVMSGNEITTAVPKAELAKLLLPLLWNAAQHSQPKQSRVAAARWASDLLTLLDLTSACHILCFLAGDSDVTAAAIAREALNVGKLSSGGHETSSSNKTPADFAELVGVLFSETSSSASSSWRPSFWEFTPKGRAVAVEYLLQCLLHDIYGGDDDAMQTFVSAIATSIIDATSHGRREYLGLLDECAGALSLCLSTSSLARSLVASKNIPLGPENIKELALGCNSSKARRLLAESWGYLYKDTLLWENDVWAETVEAALRSCCELIERKGASVGNKHGAAFMGGACIKVYRQHPTLNASDSMASLASR